MKVATTNADQSWALLNDGYFRDFEQMAQSIRGWSVDFRQLDSGRSRADLLQLGSRDFLVTRFQMSSRCVQRGSTPPGMSTLGIVEDGAGYVTTPEGILTDREMTPVHDQMAGDRNRNAQIAAAESAGACP